jgi:hypothetical protein
MVMDQLERDYSLQGWLVIEGMIDSMACLAAICTLMSFKSQMNYRRPADERELIMYACLLIGLLIPMLEFCMRAGPVSYVGWVASESIKTDGTGLYSGFADTHYQVIAVGLQTVEALFTWLNTFADFLLGIGFIQLSFIGTQRAFVIMNDTTRLVGFWTGGLFLAAFVMGMMRETSTIVGGDAYVLFSVLGLALEAILGLVLVPVYFVLLAGGLGRVTSVEDMNKSLGAIAQFVGEATASDVAEGKKALRAAVMSAEDRARKAEEEMIKRAASGEQANPVADRESDVTADAES